MRPLNWEKQEESSVSGHCHEAGTEWGETWCSVDCRGSLLRRFEENASVSETEMTVKMESHLVMSEI